MSGKHNIEFGKATKKRDISSIYHFHRLSLLCLHVNLLNWQWTSRYDGDLVAKFYYANNKLVWEILDAGLKRKIEINWENISALKVIFPDGGPGTLEIMV